MTRTDLYEELLGLADSLDDHVPAGDVSEKLRALAEAIDTKGLEEGD